MPRKKEVIPEYKTVIHNGNEYFRTRIKDADGKRVAIYGLTRKELNEKVKEAQREIDDISFRKGILRKVVNDEVSHRKASNITRI